MPFSPEPQAIIAPIQKDVAQALSRGGIAGEHAKRPSRGLQRHEARGFRKHITQEVQKPAKSSVSGLETRARASVQRGSEAKMSAPSHVVYVGTSERVSGQAPQSQLGILSGVMSEMRSVDSSIKSDLAQVTQRALTELTSKAGVEAFAKVLGSLSAKELEGVKNLNQASLEQIGLDTVATYLKDNAPKGTIASLKESLTQAVEAVSSGSAADLAKVQEILSDFIEKAAETDPDLARAAGLLTFVIGGAGLAYKLGGKRGLLAFSSLALLVEQACAPVKAPEYVAAFQVLNRVDGRPEVSSVDSIPLSDPNAKSSIEALGTNRMPDALLLVDTMQQFVVKNRESFIKDGINPDTLKSQYYHINDGNGNNMTFLLTKLKDVSGANGPLGLYYITYLDARQQNVVTRLGIQDPNIVGQSPKYGDVPATMLSLLREGEEVTDPMLASFVLEGKTYWVFLDPTGTGESIVVSADAPAGTEVTASTHPPAAETTLVPATQTPGVEFAEVSFNPGGVSSVPTAEVLPTTISLTPTPDISGAPTPDTVVPPPSPDAVFDTESGYWTRSVETGETRYWIPIQMTAVDVESGVTGHWLESRMMEGETIFFNDPTIIDTDDDVPTIPFAVYSIENRSQLRADFYLKHPDQTSDFGPTGPLAGKSYLTYINNRLIERYYGRDAPNIPIEDWEEFFQGIQNETIFIDQWKVSEGYRAVIIDKEIAASDPEFRLTDGIYWKVMVGPDGELIGVVATSEQKKLSDQDLRIMLLAPMWEVILTDGPLPETIKSFYGGPGRPDAAGASSRAGSDFTINGIRPKTNFLDIVYPE